MADPIAPFAEWPEDDAPLHVSFADINTRYSKSQWPLDSERETLQLRAWRGERVSAQVVVWSSNAFDRLYTTVSPWRSAVGTLSKEALHTHFVRYVMSDAFACGCCDRPTDNAVETLVADMLDNQSCLPLEARTVRPIWITIDVPSTAQSGLYQTTLTVHADRKSRNLRLSLEVIDRTLPPVAQWNFFLDLWQHPAAVARVEGVELWSDAHFEALRRVMTPLAQAGQKVITTTLNRDPWNHQCYDGYADMIRWTRHADGQWSYDYTIFDRWVELMLDLGINRQIACYSLLPWNDELHYWDDVQGAWVEVSATPGKPLFEELWAPFLTDFVNHLQSKQWLDKCNIAMDERAPEQMDIAVDLLARYAPQLGISLADNHNSYMRYDRLQNICVSAKQLVPLEQIAARRQAGKVTTYYVCCSHRYPNQFTFSDPAESTVAAWYAVAHDYDGFLRWAYNSWTEDPLRDSRYIRWPAGDTYIVYPGARSSIRFERLRDGIEDAEKIRLLRATWAQDTTAQSTLRCAQLDEAISSLGVSSSDETLHERLDQAEQLLNTL
jgi:hypothetical protein